MQNLNAPGIIEQLLNAAEEKRGRKGSPFHSEIFDCVEACIARGMSERAACMETGMRYAERANIKPESVRTMFERNKQRLIASAAANAFTSGDIAAFTVAYNQLSWRYEKDNDGRKNQPKK
jgi:cation transport regulator ChaB